MACLVRLPGGTKNKGNYNKTGPYYVRLWLPTEKRAWIIPCKTKDKRKAEQILKLVKNSHALVLARIEEDIRKTVENTLGIDHTLTIEKAVNKYLNLKSKLISKSTVKAYRYSLNNLMDALRNNTRITDIKRSDYDLVLGYLKERVNNTTVNIRLRGIRTFLRWLVEERYLDELPFKVRMVKLDDTLVRYLNADELKRIYQEVTDPVIRATFKVAEKTGMRLAELNRSKLEGDWIRIIGKGKKERIIPFPTEQMENYMIMKSANYRPDRISKSFTKARRKAGIPDDKGKTFHSFRHTYALYQKMVLGDLHMVSRLLGHSSITVTEDNYANFDDRYLKQVFKNYKFTA